MGGEFLGSTTYFAVINKLPITLNAIFHFNNNVNKVITGLIWIAEPGTVGCLIKLIRVSCP